MGITYEELKQFKGNSIILERQENIQIEKTLNNFIRRKHTIVRERFPGEERTKTIYKESKKKAKGSKKSEKEEHQKFKEQHFNNLENLIQHEIKNLKKEQSRLKFSMYPRTKNKKTTNSGVQNEDITWAENLIAIDGKATRKEEVTVEKFSQHYQGVSISPRYTDKDMAVRPKMRTIASQMGTPKVAADRGAFGDFISSNDLPFKQEYDKDISIKIKNHFPNISAQNDAIINCCHGMCYSVGRNVVCQRCNMLRDCNRVFCNQRKYHESKVTPQREYSYCREEFYYDNNNAPQINVRRHCTDLNTQHFYCHKQDKSTSPKSRSTSKSTQHHGDLIKKYETSLNSKPVKKYKETADKYIKPKETCEEYALGKDRDCQEKKKHTKERTKSKERSKSRVEKDKTKSMISEHKNRNITYIKLQNESPSKLVENLDRDPDEDGKFLKNTKYIENQQIDESSTATASTFKVRTKQTIFSKTFQNNCATPNYSLDSAECYDDNPSHESQCPLETFNMLKKMKIREYKAGLPSLKMRVKPKRSSTKVKENFKERNDKIKNYKEYINKYRKEIEEDSEEETKTSKERLRICQNEVQTLGNQLQTAKKQTLINQTQLSKTKTLENLPKAFRDQLQVFENGPQNLEDQQQRLKDQIQTSKDAKDQPHTSRNLQTSRGEPQTSSNRQQTSTDELQTMVSRDQPDLQKPKVITESFDQPQISTNFPQTSKDQLQTCKQQTSRGQSQFSRPSCDPETSTNQFSIFQPISQQQHQILRDEQDSLKLQPRNSRDQVHLSMQQSFRESRDETESLRNHLQATNDKTLTSRDQHRIQGDEPQTSTNPSQAFRDQPSLNIISQPHVYKDQSSTCRYQRNVDVEVNGIYVDEKYEYGPTRCNDYDKSKQRNFESYTKLGREKCDPFYRKNYRDEKEKYDSKREGGLRNEGRDYESVQQTYATENKPDNDRFEFDSTRARDYDNINKVYESQQEYSNQDNRANFNNAETRGHRDKKRHYDNQAKCTTNIEDRNVNSERQTEYKSEDDRDYDNGNKSKAFASQKEHQNEVERHLYISNTAEIGGPLDISYIEYNSRHRKNSTENERYYDTRIRGHGYENERYNDSIRHIQYRSDRDRDYDEVIELIHENERGPRDRNYRDFSPPTYVFRNVPRYRQARGNDETYQVKLSQYRSNSEGTQDPKYDGEYNSRRQTENERYYIRAKENGYNNERNLDSRRQSKYRLDGNRDYDKAIEHKNKYEHEYKDLKYNGSNQPTHVLKVVPKYHKTRDYDEPRYHYDYEKIYHIKDNQDYETTDMEFSGIKKAKAKQDKSFISRRNIQYHSEYYKDYDRSKYNESSRKSKDHEQQMSSNFNDHCEHIYLYQKPSSSSNNVKELKQEQIPYKVDEERNRTKQKLQENKSQYEETEEKENRKFKTNFPNLKEELRIFENQDIKSQRASLEDETPMESSKIEPKLNSNSSHEQFKQAINFNLSFQTDGSSQNKQIPKRQATEQESSPKAEQKDDLVHNLKEGSSSRTSYGGYSKNKHIITTRYTQEKLTTDQTFITPKKHTDTEGTIEFLNKLASSATFTKLQNSFKTEYLEDKSAQPVYSNQNLEVKPIQQQHNSLVDQIKQEITTYKTFGQPQKSTITEEALGYINNLLASCQKYGLEEECLNHVSTIAYDLINKLSSCTTNQIVTSKTRLEEDRSPKENKSERQLLKEKSKDSGETLYTHAQFTSYNSRQDVLNMDCQSKTSRPVSEEDMSTDSKPCICAEKQSLKNKSTVSLDEKTSAETQITNQQSKFKAGIRVLEKCHKPKEETSVKAYSITQSSKVTDYEEEISEIHNSPQSKKETMTNDTNLLEKDDTFVSNVLNSDGTKKKKKFPHKTLDDTNISILSNKEEKTPSANISNDINDYYSYKAEMELYHYQKHTEPQNLKTAEDYERYLEYQENIPGFPPPNDSRQQSPSTVEYQASQDTEKSQYYNSNQSLPLMAPYTTYEYEHYCSPDGSETDYIPLPSLSRVSQKSGGIYENRTSARFIKESICDAAPLPLKSILKTCRVNEATAETCEFETYRSTSSISFGQEECINMQRGSVRTFTIGQEKISKLSNENIDTVIPKNEFLNPLRKQTNSILSETTVKQPIYKDLKENVYQHTCKSTNAGPKYSESMNRYSEQNAPSFTHCPCMMNTYLDLLKIYYKNKNKLNFNKNVLNR